MSAWIVNKQHIDTLIQAALTADRYNGPVFTWYDGNDQRQQLTAANADETGRMLWLECQKSVASRYPGDRDGGWPGPIGLTLSKINSYRYKPVNGHVVAVSVLKQIDCYEYQSCEHDGWTKSDAHAFCQALRKKMIAMVPGYEEAPWGVD
jgi:hypothetical protein